MELILRPPKHQIPAAAGDVLRHNDFRLLIVIGLLVIRFSNKSPI